MKLLMVVLVVCISTPMAQWFENGRPVKETESMKSWGKFSAKLLITDRKDELFENWNKNTPGVDVPEVETIGKGKEIAGIVVFSGCQMDDAGECNSTVSYQVLKPNGQQYSEIKETELWKDKPAPDGKNLQLSVGYIGLVIDPEDPFGEYTVVAVIKDKFADKEIRLRKKISVARMNMGAYAAGPYGDPVLGKEDTHSKFLQFNSHMSKNVSRIGTDQIQGFQENAYVLIDCMVKNGFPASMTGLPRGNAPLMKSFKWADSIGVWGAGLVAQNMDTTSSNVPKSVEKNGFSLSMTGTYLQLGSLAQKWEVTFPYNFMIFNTRRIKDNFGFETDMAIISTGFSKQAARPGFSQATIMVISSLRGDFQKFKEQWVDIYNSDRKKPTSCESEIVGYECVGMTFTDTKINGNIYFKKSGKYCVGISYMGLPETFRHNQLHVRDFIQTLKYK